MSSSMKNEHDSTPSGSTGDGWSTAQDFNGPIYSMYPGYDSLPMSVDNFKSPNQSFTNADSDDDEESGAVCPRFLRKLRAILEDESNWHAVSWVNDGRAFKVHDQTVFARDVLLKAYNHQHWPAFVHQLKGYGFSRSPDNAYTFSHKRFVAHLPELAKAIARKKSKKRRRAAEKEQQQQNKAAKTEDKGEGKRIPYMSLSSCLAEAQETQKASISTTMNIFNRWRVVEDTARVTGSAIADLETRTSSLNALVEKFALAARRLQKQAQQQPAVQTSSGQTSTMPSPRGCNNRFRPPSFGSSFLLTSVPESGPSSAARAQMAMAMGPPKHIRRISKPPMAKA